MELLANAPDPAAFAAAAAATGYTDTNGGVTAIQTNGGWQGQVGSWFFNYVGAQYKPTGAMTTDPEGNPVQVMEARPGVWARLRINGTPDDNFANFLAAVAAHGVTVYRQIPHDHGVCWSSDGVTCFADQTIGQIGLIM
jgi:hypothetical protein